MAFTFMSLLNIVLINLSTAAFPHMWNELEPDLLPLSTPDGILEKTEYISRWGE